MTRLGYGILLALSLASCGSYSSPVGPGGGAGGGVGGADPAGAVVEMVVEVGVAVVPEGAARWVEIVRLER